MSIKLLPRERYYAAFRHGFSTNQDGELGTVRWRRWLAKSPFEPKRAGKLDLPGAASTPAKGSGSYPATGSGAIERD